MDDLAYYENLEKLANAMTEHTGVDIDQVYAILRNLCGILRVCKGVTEFFSSEAQERAGKGETFVCYDSGSESDMSISDRTTMPGGISARCQVYHEAGIEPWNEQEKSRITTVMRLVIGFLSRSRLNHLVERLTMHDEQGYKNFLCFKSRIAQMGGEKLIHHAAIRFNLKHFSVINEEIGREDSNVVMRRYIDSLEEAGGEGAIVCRLGGDNYVMLCDQDYLGVVIGQIEGAPIPFGENERITVSATAGIFLINEDYGYNGPEDIIERIMSAYGAAKAGSNGDIIFFNDMLRINRDKAARIKKLFPIALKNEEIQVYYQPKINVQNNMLIGAEALSRWHQDDGIVLPDDFIPVLEQSMDICRLDYYVLEHVCRDINRWLNEGRQVVRISVNISRRHMIEEDILYHILDIIDMYDVPHEYIEIELTETTTDVEFKKLKDIVTGLQEEGIFAAVDDFGMGYSSLNLIRDIPWNVIKVDKCFVPLDTEKDESARSVMFKNMVNMLHEMGRECVTEGVETKEQVRKLRSHGSVVAQGYYYDRPLPTSEFEKRMDMRYYPEDND